MNTHKQGQTSLARKLSFSKKYFKIRFVALLIGPALCWATLYPADLPVGRRALNFRFPAESTHAGKRADFRRVQRSRRSRAGRLPVAARPAWIGATDPVPQTLPYAQDFSGLAHNSTEYPPGWQGWLLAGGSSNAFKQTEPAGDEALRTGSAASTSTGGIHNYDGKIGFLATSGIDPALAVAFDTTGYANLIVSFDVMTIRNPAGRINQVDFQYRICPASPCEGAFVSVGGAAGGIYQNNLAAQTGSGVTAPQNLQTVVLALPAAVADRSNVQFRWVQRDFAGSGSRPSFAVDNVALSGTPLCLSPSIEAAPADASRTAGERASFAVTANGTEPLFYRWRREGSEIAGADSNIYEIPSVVTSDAGRFDVVVTNSCGSATSPPAFLSVSKAAAAVSLGELEQTYDGSPRTPGVATSPPNLAVELIFTGTGTTVYGPASEPPVNAGTYRVTATIDDADYDGSQTEMFVVSRRSATVTPLAAAKIFGEPDPPLTGFLNGFVAADAVSAAYSREPGEAVGSYRIAAVLSAAGDLANYDVVLGEAALEIHAWTLTGFYQPVGTANTYPLAVPQNFVWNTVRGGSTVPLKFNIRAGGAEKTDAAIASFGVQRIACASSGQFNEEELETTSTGGTVLRYTGTPGLDGHFIQNWQTPQTTNECYRVVVTAQDGSVLAAFFRTRK